MRGLLLTVLILFPVALIGWIAAHRPPQRTAAQADRGPAASRPAAEVGSAPAPSTPASSAPAIALSATQPVARPATSPAPAAASAPGLAAAPGSAPAGRPADEDRKLRSLFRLPLVGVELDGQVKLYDGQGLFDYIDGAAPIFIERNFRKLAAVDLLTPGDGSLTCDIYDMRAADNAASIYAKERSPTATAVAIGDQAHLGSLSLVFRRDRYYVKLTAFDKTAEALLPELARALVGRM